jgi:uncharacterized membrane protein HdeD (DUF308 family)
MDYPLQWALTSRAVLAMLFGVANGAMILFAFWMPRIALALMGTLITGFTLLDGLVALFAAAWRWHRGGRWRLLGCKGLAGIAAGIAVALQAPGEKPDALAIFACWAIVMGLLQAVEALLLGAHQGRLGLWITAVLAVAFGSLILARPPQDLMTMVMQVAAYGILLGIVRLILAIRLKSPDLV